MVKILPETDDVKHTIARILHWFIVASMWLAGAYLLFFVVLLFI